jgi:hypothetical protein
MFEAYDELAAERLRLDHTDTVGESEYRHILEFLGLMIANAEDEGESFGDREALQTLSNVEERITGLKALFAKRLAATNRP